MKQRKRTLLLVGIITCLYAANVVYAKMNTTRSSLAIIGYHHIVPDEDKDQYYKNTMWVASLSSFEEQMELLHREGYHTLTLDEVAAWKRGEKELKGKNVVLTFDDGFYSTVKFAQPVLKRYGFQGSVFVIGSAINNQHGAYDPSIRQHASLKDMEDQSTLRFYSHSYDLHKKESANGGFRVNALNKDQLREDTLKEKALVSIQYYAYPYGKYNPLIQEVLQEEGVSLAFGFNENRKATRADSDYGLPRFNVNAYTRLDVFQAMLDSEV